MSGGVDSSVAAGLLKQQGYRVVGVYMQNWTQSVGGVDCPWRQDLADAKAAAAALQIPFKIFNFESEYKQKVVDVMVAEYQAGRTPNPDVLCNQDIKFKLFFETALADGADFVATGHYASTQDGRLMTAVDRSKDQTYFLYRLTAAVLHQTLFPLHGLTKPEVRRLARDMGLPNATKPDSQGICFVGQVSLKDFLKQYIETDPGPIIRTSDRQIVGQHDGAVFFTIGQRTGLRVGGDGPYYVTAKDIDTNSIFVTNDPTDLALESNQFTLTTTHWITRKPIKNYAYQIRSRYRAQTIDGYIDKLNGVDSITLTLPDRAVSPGQSAVIYDGDEVVGGGIITWVKATKNSLNTSQNAVKTAKF